MNKQIFLKISLITLLLLAIFRVNPVMAQDNPASANMKVTMSVTGEIIKSTAKSITVSYPVTQLEAGDRLNEKLLEVYLVYEDTYDDGTIKERIEKITSFTLDKSIVEYGTNTFTVTEKVTGYDFSDSLSVIGIITNPKVTSSNKSGIILYAYPKKQMAGTQIRKEDIILYWEYEDTYNTGEIKMRSSKDRIANFNLSKDTLSKGNNEITITKEESGMKLSASFVTFGNYLYQKEIDGITCKYAYQNAYVGESLHKEYAKVLFTYKYIYADGSEYLKQQSSSKCTSFDFNKSTISLGANTVTVTEKSTGKGFSDSFIIVGEKKATITPTTTPTATPTPTVTPKTTTTPTPSPTNAPKVTTTPIPTNTPKNGTTITTTPTPSSSAKLVTSTTASATGGTQSASSQTTNPGKGSVSTPVPLAHKDTEETSEDEETLITNRYFSIESLIEGKKKTINYINGKIPETETLRFLEDSSKLLEDVLKDNETELLKEDSVANVTLKISDEVLLSEEDRIAFANVLGENDYIGRIYDISLEKRINGNAPIIVTRLSERVTLTLNIPRICYENGRDYFILRMHLNDNGVRVVTTLPDTDASNDTISFETDRFSYFAICYSKEKEPEIVEEEPCEHIWSYIPNGDSTHLVNCTNCDQSLIEECTFTEGVCIYCGYKDPDFEEDVPIWKKYWYFIAIGLFIILLIVLVIVLIVKFSSNSNADYEEDLPEVGEITLNTKTNQIERSAEITKKEANPPTPLDEIMVPKANKNAVNQSNYSGVPDFDYGGYTEYEGREENHEYSTENGSDTP